MVEPEGNETDELEPDPEEVEELARYDERHLRMMNEPPRCLDGFVVERTEVPDVAFDGHGSESNSVFRVRCRCGSETFRVIGHATTNDYGGRKIDIFVGPLELICDACGQAAEIFNSEKHGYDAEVGGIITTIRGRGPRLPYTCKTCDRRAMHVWARFEHMSDVCEDSFAEEYGGNEQDFFSWFTLVGRCTACAQIQSVADFECA